MIASFVLLLGMAVPQEATQEQDASASAPLEAPLGQIAPSSVGQAGQRQTREDLAAQTGIAPMARIDARIQNRVQSRIRNRIDRYYDPVANATSPFAVAGEQIRQAGRPRR